MKFGFILIIFIAGMMSGAYLWEHQQYASVTSKIENSGLLKSEHQDRVLFINKDNTELRNEISVLQGKVDELKTALDEVENVPDNENNRERVSRLRKIRTLNLDMLMNAGINEAVAQEIIRRKDLYEYKKMELRDRAVRGGLKNKNAYRKELNQLKFDDGNIRSELGDEVFDRYLFASGRDNRVLVSDIMQNSPASYSGVMIGDVIVSYNDKKIYSWHNLNKLTAKGRSDESVLLNVSRDNEIYNILVPRGPLGIKLEVSRVKP